MLARIQRWLRWKWWELLLIVLAVLTAYWLISGAAVKYVSMTVTESGTVVSEEKPWVEMQDYYSGGRYLLYPASSLCQVTVTGDAEVTLRLPLLPPHALEVCAYTLSSPDEILSKPDILSAAQAVDYTRSGRDLTVRPDFTDGAHQFVQVRAFWYGFGSREVHYVFLLTQEKP